MKYAENTIPKNYVCKDCGITGVRLWRGYQEWHIHLRCTDCMCKAEDMPRHLVELDSYNIGWSVCAIPDEEGDGYWGYTSVPDEGLLWWQKLPLSPS